MLTHVFFVGCILGRLPAVDCGFECQTHVKNSTGFVDMSVRATQGGVCLDVPARKLGSMVSKWINGL